MPVPNYFRPIEKPLNLQALTGGLKPEEIQLAIDAGARIVVCQWVVSALILTLRRNKVVYAAPGESIALKILPYTTLTLLLGWWGFPWGLIYTPEVMWKNSRGGTDMTAAVYEKVRSAQNNSSLQI